MAAQSSRGKAAPKAGAAARRERKQEQPTVEFAPARWLGIDEDADAVTLTLPAALPGELMWDIAAVERSPSPAALIDMLRRIYGDEQDSVVREKVSADGIGFDRVDEVLDKLLGEILDAYETSAGE